MTGSSLVTPSLISAPDWRSSAVNITLPDWLPEIIPSPDAVYPTLDDQMDLAIRLSAANVEHDTGGPFGAAIFWAESGKLIAAGVNRVMPLSGSLLHGENVALLFAQARLASFTLKDLSAGPIRMVTSCQPCVQCWGAMCWAGLAEMVFGATDEDARAIGFDEGPVPANWRELLLNSPSATRVLGPVRRDEAAAVLQEFNRLGRTKYNADAKTGDD